MTQIRLAEFDDLPCIKEMCDNYIGKDFYSADFLQKCFYDDKHFFAVYTDDNGIPVSFIYMFIDCFENARKILKIADITDYFDGLNDNDLVGVFKTTCTNEKYRRKGILKKLMSFCETVLKEQGVSTIFLDALKLPSGKIPAANGIEKTGFKKLFEIKAPWSDIDSFCPYCKSQFCKCDAILCMKGI